MAKIKRKFKFKYVERIAEALNDPYTGRSGKARLAKELELFPQQICKFFEQRRVPEHHVPVLVQLCRRLGIERDGGGQMTEGDFYK